LSKIIIIKNIIFSLFLLPGLTRQCCSSLIRWRDRQRDR